MARTVADTALLANIMSGRHPGDHTTVADASSITPDPAAVAGLRIALCLRLGNYPVAPDVEANTRRVAEALTAAGAVVEEIVLPWTVEEISRTMFTHFGYLLGPAMEDETAGSEPQLAAYTRRFMADARVAAEHNRYVDGVRAETLLQAQLAEAMTGFGALLCPASAISALEADADYLNGIDANGNTSAITGKRI